MGPTGAPTEIAEQETVLLARRRARQRRALLHRAGVQGCSGAQVLYFAGYKNGADLFKQDDIEGCTDQVIWCTDTGAEIAPRRPQDAHFRGNIVQAMLAYGRGARRAKVPLPDVRAHHRHRVATG